MKKKPKRKAAPAKGAAKKPRAAVVARAKAASSRMSKAADFSRAEVSIMSRMAELDDDSPRYRVLEAALAFKSSWIILGELLAEVHRTQLWRGWGYPSFERFAADELFLTAATAKKLVRSYQWIGNEAPELLPKVEKGRFVLPKSPHEGALPELNAVQVLAEAKNDFEEHRVTEDAYLALKQAAFDGETAASLRRTLKEAIPDHLRKKAPDDKVRHLRRALTAAVKVIDELREWDAGGEAAGDDLMISAEQLRDAIAVRLPRSGPEPATP
jgi:hypothetical protein